MKIFPDKRNFDIPDPNHLPEADRVKFYSHGACSGIRTFNYPPEVIENYATRYGVPVDRVEITSNGLLRIRD